MQRILIGAALLVCLAHPAIAQEVIGDWQGTLKVRSVELRLVLHIGRESNGALKATLDSVDQGMNGIPVTSISLSPSKLKFTVESLNGLYEGTLNAAATTVSGRWSQRQRIPLVFTRAANTATVQTMHNPATPSDIDGAWIGTANAGGVKLRIVFHITNTQAGLTATMDIPDQGITGIPVTVVTRHGSSLTLELHQLGGAFQGTISPDWTTIGGTWTQGGASQPFTLKRVKDAAQVELRRPQNPAKPYRYRGDEVTFENEAAGIRLGGTLTVPEGAMKVPGVVLIATHTKQGRRRFLL